MRSFLVVVAVAVSSWDNLLTGEMGPIAWVMVALLIVDLAWGAASWLGTTYRIEGAELRVDTGVISRQSRRIRVNRLQSVDIGQPFVARLFGLAEIKMDVAGSGSGIAAYLPRKEAQDLRHTARAPGRSIHTRGRQNA